MKNEIKSKKKDPVPRRGKLFCILGSVLLMTASIAAGALLSGHEASTAKIPVVLADGSVITPPWYITVDGEKTVLVASKERAENVIEDIVEKYQGESIIDIEIKETVEAQQMKISNGDDLPRVLTASQAMEELQEGNNGKGYITVVTTEETTEDEDIEFKQEYKTAESLYIGETKIETEGVDGEKKITKEVVKENGKTVDEKVIDEEVVKEPREEVILTGTKAYGGYGGSENTGVDAGVSYDENATYEPLANPVDTMYVSSGFGTRWGRMHRGIDLALGEGNPIYAADSGTVYFSGDGGGYGNLIKIDHGNGMQTYYAHCSRLTARQGQYVQRGEVIAFVGSTGNSTGPHLHFEVIINGTCIDPQSMLK